MNTDIRFLQQLEADLTEAAAREAAAMSGTSAAASGAGAADDRSRRLPRRERPWNAIAAGLVAFLVLAGSIGFLRQNSAQDSATSGSLAEREARSGVGAGTVPAATPPGAALSGEDAGQSGTRADGLTSGGIAYDSVAGAAGGGDQFALNGTQPGLNGGATGLPDVQAQGDLSKIVRDGRISVVVRDGTFESSLAQVSRVATSLGGFVLASATRDQNVGTLTLRIPARRFDVAMDRLRGIGEVRADQVSGDDVTAEFIDQTARLSILLDRRDLLQSLQNDATSSSEILRLAGLIEQTQLEIEKSQGQLRFIKDQVAEATIKVDLREEHAPQDDPDPASDTPSLTDAVRLGWEGFLRVVGAVIVGLGYLVPIAVIGAAIWAVVTLVRRRRRAAS